MELKPQIFHAVVMHKRLFPKENFFSYKIYYLLFPLPCKLKKNPFIYFDKKDLGYRDNSDPHKYVSNILKKHNINTCINKIMLMTMPKIMGYVFNPVSFYFCYDIKENLKAVLVEVHNTFQEQSFYLCYNDDLSDINNSDYFETEKIFHVSPFLERKGSYQFNFKILGSKLKIFIDYYDENNKKKLVTSLIGSTEPYSNKKLTKVFWKYPFITLKTILLIHWQALKLFVKLFKFYSKPVQLKKKLLRAHRIKK